MIDNSPVEFDKARGEEGLKLKLLCDNRVEMLSELSIIFVMQDFYIKGKVSTIELLIGKLEFALHLFDDGDMRG